MFEGIKLFWFSIARSRIVPDAAASSERKTTLPPKGRGFLILIGAIFVAPIVVSSWAFNYWRPSTTTNHGELLTVGPVPPMLLKDQAGKSRSLTEFTGKWLLMTVDHADCDSTCEKKLYIMRQVSVAQGKDQQRLQRIWIVGRAENGRELTRLDQGLQVFKVEQAPVLPANGSVNQYIYLVDPLGNMVLRYTLQSEPRKIIKDLVRLLKISQIG